MRFYTDGNIDEFVFEDAAQYPAGRPVELMQVRERSAAGTSHVETYSIPIARRNLSFVAMNDTDYIGLLNWFLNVAEGMQNTFYFEDERGAIYHVRCEDRKFNFRETSYLRYSGTLNLEILNA